MAAIDDSRSPLASPKNKLCSRLTAIPITTTPSPASAPTAAASTRMLISLARTQARKRRGASKGRSLSDIAQLLRPLPRESKSFVPNGARIERAAPRRINTPTVGLAGRGHELPQLIC